MTKRRDFITLLGGASAWPLAARAQQPKVGSGFIAGLARPGGNITGLAYISVDLVMHMMVTNLDQWWAIISRLDLESRYKVRAPVPPKLEPWGLRVGYIFDPSGVLWHLAEEAR